GGLSSVLPWLGFHDREYRLVVKGLPLEIVTRLQRAGAASEFVLDPKCLSALSLDNHYWKCLAMQMMVEEGVKVMLHTQVVDTLGEGDRITGVVVESKLGRQNVLGDIVIDCSGDGDVAVRGGVAYEKGRKEDGLVQSPTLVFRLGGVDREAFVSACKDPRLNYREWISPYPDLWRKMMKRIDTVPVFICGGFAGLIEEARRCGEFHVPQSRIVGVKLHRPDQFLVVMTRVLGLDPTDTYSLTQAYTRTYQQIPELIRFFNKWVPGFENAYLLEIAPMLGVRESRRITGDYVLSIEDLIEGRRFPDAVCMGGYHMDIHRPSGTWVESRNVKSYTIPLRSFIACGAEGLMMAGKCFSGTHEALASTRVVPICMGQGQAAGTAAALAVRKGTSVRDIDIGDLQTTLMDQGAELGQTLGEPDPEVIEEVGQLPLDEPLTTGDRDEASSDSSAWIDRGERS
ncbi:FAD-dependent oxidoreductase, partial [Candidatus Poribacteria bacterium]